MKISALGTLFVILLAIGVLGYGFYMTLGSTEEVNAKLAELTPANEKEPINTDILNDAVIKKVQALRAYGTHPIIVDPKSINRPNPFDGI